MTRKTYSVLLPSMTLGVVVLGFVLGFIFPSLPTGFYLGLAIACGAIILIIDRIARRKVDEVLNDERIQGHAYKAAWISFRITSISMFVLGFVFISLLPRDKGFHLLGIGAVCSVSMQALVYWIAFKCQEIRESR